MAGFRPGGTPLRLDLLTAGTRGTVDLNGSQSVRSDAELINRLRVAARRQPGQPGPAPALGATN